MIDGLHPEACLCSDHEQEVLIFVSDIHLDTEIEQDHDPSGFLEALGQSIPSDCSKLFILGDLFDTWVGDDLVTGSKVAIREAFTQLAQRAQSDIKFYLMHGNRDFLLGQDFLKDLNAFLIDEVFILEMFGLRVGLTHGDALCTDDQDYQHFREQVRQAAWQTAFLAKPLDERRAIASSIRAESERAKQGKSMAIMDVNPAAVEALVARHQLQGLIHGHTHRPAKHSGQFTRWVLPDWDKNLGRGGWLRWDKSGFSAQGPFGVWT